MSDRTSVKRAVFVRSAILAALVGFLGVAPAAEAGGRPGQRKDLIANGGFETGTAGWQPDAKHELVTDAAAAHSGQACLSGQVDRPDRSRRLKRTVPVKANNLYEFEIWARATGRTKLVLWARLPGSKQRQHIAAWKNVPRKWKRFAVPITVKADGQAVLEIISPSSHGAPAGKIWIDDVALYETAMPETTCISGERGFNDEPSMAWVDDGSIYVAWNRFRGEADSLCVARCTFDKSTVKVVGEWQVPTGKRTWIVHPRVVAAGDRAILLYAAETKGNWDVFAVPLDKQGPGTPSVVCTHPDVDVKPIGVWRDGVLWVVWESNRGGVRRVFTSSLRQGRFGPAVAVSPDGVSGYSPALAALASGEVCVAWHGFSDNNYDVHLRRRLTDGTWTDPRRLTSAPSIDRHPVLVARGNELWLLYENAETKGYRIGATNRRRIVVAKVGADGLEAPTGLAKSPLSGRCEAATAAFDSAGRLWIAHLRPRLPRAGWDVFLTGYAGTKWQALVRLSGRKGLDRVPALAIRGGRAVAAFQNDDIPGSWSDADKTASAKSDIYLATVDLEPSPPATPMALEPLTEPNEAFEAGRLRLDYGEDTKTPTIEYHGRTLKLFYGSLHEHSDLSVCNRAGDQSLEESYQHLRDIARLDFACMTDHGYNQSPYLWAYSAKMARIHGDPGRFVTLLGQEWTSTFEKYDDKHPYGYYGHRNLILSDLYFPRWWNARNGQTPPEVWAELRRMNADFVHIPHQLADTGNVPTDWSFHDEVAQPVAEIFQIRGSYEHDGAPRQAKRTTPKGHFIQDAWGRGIVIGVIASPDHGGGVGKACVFARELTREAVLDALRARHCFGTTAARMVLDVRVNGHLMGEKIAAPDGKPVEVKIRVRCPAEIDRVEVCRSNEFIYCKEPAARTADLTFVDTKPLDGRSYYYVRVVQKDEEIAWSSPVWLGYP